MTNEQETIDGVKGEWRTVTKPSEVKVGQRVRYSNNFSYGFSKEDARVITRVNSYDADSKSVKGCEYSNNIFDGYWKTVQAFFPLPVRKSRKVAKVRIYQNERSGYYRFETWVNNVMCEKSLYSKRSHAIRGAKRFCKAIGYECEIVK